MDDIVFCPKCHMRIHSYYVDSDRFAHCWCCGAIISLGTSNKPLKVKYAGNLYNNVDRHKQLCKKLNELYEKKNHDYGDSFHRTYLEEGMAMPRIRLSDKFNRFCTLSKSKDGQKVTDESIQDTLMDLANYALMTVMELDREQEEQK